MKVSATSFVPVPLLIKAVSKYIWPNFQTQSNRMHLTNGPWFLEDSQSLNTVCLQWDGPHVLLPYQLHFHMCTQTLDFLAILVNETLQRIWMREYTSFYKGLQHLYAYGVQSLEFLMPRWGIYRMQGWNLKMEKTFKYPQFNIYPHCSVAKLQARFFDLLIYVTSKLKQAIATHLKLHAGSFISV